MRANLGVGNNGNLPPRQHGVSNKPMCQPDGPLIKDLIRQRGYSVAGFARHIGRKRSERNLRNALAGKRVGIDLIRPVARGLRVKPGDISDWKGDDEFWDEAEMSIPAA
jgi:hypothetical protein